jgi:hypothetical protein
MSNRIVCVYSRARAIRDGVLIDVTDTAREAGLAFPTAITASVWAECVRIPEGAVGQDEAGRLWDILWLCRCGILHSEDLGPELFFQLHVRNNDRGASLVTLKAVCGPGDELEPVITIMLPDED